MSAIFDWVKDIVFYLILLTVALHLIPNKKYEKYMRLFAGMIMIMVVMRPIVQMLSMDDVFDGHFLENLEEEERMFENVVGDQEFLGVQEGKFEEEYIRQIKMYAQVEAGRLGMEMVSFQAQLQEQEGVYVPAFISMSVRMKEESGQESGIDVENVTIPQIIIRRQGRDDLEQVRSQQAEMLSQILSQYYGISQEQVQVTVVSAERG